MFQRLSHIVPIAVIGCFPMAAWATNAATGASAVPEPADYALFAFAVGGLIVGQRWSRQNERSQKAESSAQIEGIVEQ